MKKYIARASFVIGTLIVASCAAPDHHKTDLETWHLHGKVKQLTELSSNFDQEDSLSQKADYAEEKTEYDMMRVVDFSPSGYIENVRTITENGTLVQKFSYRQDSLVDQTQTFQDGKLSSYETYVHYPDGRIKTKTYHDKDGKVIFNMDYAYQKNTITMTGKQADGSDTGVQKYVLDDNGMIIEKTFFKNGIDSRITTRYRYNDNGDVTEITNTDNMLGTPAIGEKYEYGAADNLGNWTTRVMTGYDGENIDNISIQKTERQIEYYN